MKRLALVLLACAGCSGTPTEALVAIWTRGLSVPDNLDQVRLLVADQSAAGNDVTHEQTLPLCPGNRSASGCFTLPITAVLIPGPTQADHRVLVQVDARLAGRTVIANATTFTFVPRTKLRLDFVLYHRCLDKTDCAAGELSCGPAGTCVPILPDPFTGEPALDLATDEDQRAPADLSQPDLAVPPDLAMVDLAPPPDLTVGPDMSCTGTNCGGSCPSKCGNGQPCLVNADCTSNACHPTTKLCVTSTCSDGFKGGNETDADCGGATCAARCKLGKGCLIQNDCGTGHCGPAGLCLSGPSWQPASSIVNTRYSHAATMGADGLMYVLGCVGANGRTVENHVVGPSQPWTLVGMMAITRAGLVAASASDDRIYAFGGASGTTFLTSIEAYTLPPTDSWTNAGISLLEPRADGAALVAPDGKIYIFGGRSSTMGPALASTEQHAVGMPMVARQAMNTARAFVAGALGSDGKVYAFGGDSVGRDMNVLSSAEVYDPVANTWTPLTPMLSTARRRATAATASDGRTYVIGGADVSGNELTSVEIYTPGAAAFLTGPPLRTARGSAAALTVPDGRIFVIAGENGSFASLRTVEYIGPDPTLTPAMGTPGTLVTVASRNHASNAVVDVFYGAGATPIATGATDEDGVVTGALTFTVPAGAPGPQNVRVVDRASRFPVTRTFLVQ
jgi:hypothetical protein